MSWEAWGDPPEPPVMETCPDCEGSGEWQDVNDGVLIVGTCARCHGEGEVERPEVYFDDDVIGFSDSWITEE